MTKLKTGLVQVYTGDGKGKTTAAFGLALRALGHDFRVIICQFLKTGDSGEVKYLSGCPNVTVQSFGRSGFIIGAPQAEDYHLAKAALAFARENLASGVDLLILDEAVSALDLKLLVPEDLIGLIKAKPAHLELVLTGRGLTQELLPYADLVTEMRAVKHPFARGIKARQGIEF